MFLQNTIHNPNKFHCNILTIIIALQYTDGQEGNKKHDAMLNLTMAQDTLSIQWKKILI